MGKKSSRACNIDAMRELAGKIDDGHAENYDVSALADEVLACFGDLNEPKEVAVLESEKEAICPLLVIGATNAMSYDHKVLVKSAIEKVCKGTLLE